LRNGHYLHSTIYAGSLKLWFEEGPLTHLKLQHREQKNEETALKFAHTVDTLSQQDKPTAESSFYRTA